MTPTEIATITRVMGPVVREFTAKAVTDAVAPLLERNAALELRILELETHPAPVAVGPAGPIGGKGDPGAGIVSLVITAEGRLLAHLTDGRSVDAGPVPQGPPGARGEHGESVVGPPGERGKDAPLPDGDVIVRRVLALIPPPERGEKGADGRDGKDADVPDIADMVARAVAALPAPTNGRDGKDAEPVDVDAVVARVAALIPVPKDGSAGADGRSVTVEDVAPLIVSEIEKRVAALPVAKDGIGFTGAVITREGHLVLTLSNGATQDIGAVVGKDGAPGRDGIGLPGKDGVDGLGFDDYDLYLDESRGWVFRLDGGERHKEWVLGLPFDAKVWAAGTTYPKGAGTTWDGHYWIALKQTIEQPGEGSTDWRLAVRRGKQGREGKQGKDGSPGRDLTSIDPSTGRKW